MSAPTLPRSFHTTRWSLVRQAAASSDPAATAALSALCEAYWYPVYAFIRSSGKSPHDAEDLTQGFFARLLEKEILAAADPDKGKLRNFLLTCVRRYVADDHDRASAQKRGAAVLFSFNPDWAEQADATAPVDDLSPDRPFQRRWALTVLEYSFQLLREEFAAASGTPVGTLKTQVLRLRQRWRELLFEQGGDNAR